MQCAPKPACRRRARRALSAPQVDADDAASTMSQVGSF
jgi:hypothetical protein